jgi:tetratricopeptide (TPR) repeat protein
VKRVLAILVALVLAGLAAWGMTRGGAEGASSVCADFERRLQAGDLESAARIRQGTRDLPPHIAAYLDALLLLATGKDAEAGAVIEAAYAAGDAARDEWRVVSLVFSTRVNAKRPEEGWAALDAYVKAHPDDPRGVVAAAQYWIEVRADAPDPDQAAAYLDRAAKALPGELPPDDPTAVRPALTERLRGRIEQTRGRLGSAVAAAEARVAAEPENAAARVQLGEAFRRWNRLDEAREAYRQARRLAPEDVAIAKQLALLLFESPDTGDEADTLTAWILGKEPGGVEARILRARAHVRKGDKEIDSAIDIYRGLLKEDLPPARRLEVLRNLAVALYDWKQGGQEGDYLRDAYLLLVEYRSLGGEIDLRLANSWERLSSLYGPGSQEPR